MTPLISRLSCRPRVFAWLHRLRLVEAVTQTNPEELSCIARYSEGRRVAIEIGTFMGVSAAIIARSLAPDGRVYCVDPYDGGEPLRGVAMRHLARSGVMDRIIMVRAFSRHALVHLPAKADFIFVDGDHSFEGLRTDWGLVKGRLASGGVACFHDTSMPPEQYCGAVDYFDRHIRNAAGFELVETCHSLNVMRRHV